MSRPTCISFWVLLAVLVFTGWLNLGVLLLSIFFSYFCLRKLDLVRPQQKWAAIALFLILLGGAAYGVAYFVQATVAALPEVATKALPSITQWATEHRIRLPFTDLNSLKDETIKIAQSEAAGIGKFADFARGATTQFIYLMVGALVAMGLFRNPRLEMDPPSPTRQRNFYSACCDEINRRFSVFYESFDMVMNAQIVISSIMALMTAIFMAAMGLPHLTVAVGVTFILGMIPVVGNFVSSVVVVAIGFGASPAKGLWTIVFLAGLHHLCFFLSGKIIGDKIRSPLWLTLLALVVGERLMGVTGMVLSPVALHYLRIEASRFPAKAKE